MPNFRIGAINSAALSTDRRQLLGLLAALPLLSPAAVASTPLDRTEFVPLGGLEQWISIKGDDQSNPVLLVVHGGPGDVQWPFANKYTPWEKYFTVVLWDQRGAGRTYGHSGGPNTPNVTLAQISQDGIELAQYLCRTLGKRKIILLGHSWGSVVGVVMAKKRPDLFAAYVGTGQVRSWKFNVQSQFDLLLAKARADNDVATRKELEAIGKPNPADTHQYFMFSRNLRSAMAQSDQDWLSAIHANSVAHKGEKDYDDAHAGMGFSGDHLLPDEVAEDLSVATKFGTAFFVIQGENDVITPTKGAEGYFGLVRAPYKRLFLIPEVGHFAFMTSGDLFLDALREKVRPVAIARGA